MRASRATLERHAYAIRRHVLSIAGGPTGAHVGGSLSCADILAVLYFDTLRTRPDDPQWEQRDYFVLSKGHASAALYGTLAERGFLSPEELASYGMPRSRLAGHPMRGVPGVEFTTGSLGHGLSLGVGLALAAVLDGLPNRVFVLAGDGEMQEGSVWEALMYGAHMTLDNLLLIVDRNGWQITGRTEETVALESLPDRISAFGWNVRVVDGHDVEALRANLAIAGSKGGPHALVALTTKGRGVPFLENRKKSHYVTLKPELLARAQAGLAASVRARK